MHGVRIQSLRSFRCFDPSGPLGFHVTQHRWCFGQSGCFDSQIQFRLGLSWFDQIFRLSRRKITRGDGSPNLVLTALPEMAVTDRSPTIYQIWSRGQGWELTKLTHELAHESVELSR